MGKTTMMLQHIKQTFPDTTKAFYVSLDNLWFATHTLTELVEYLYTHGVTHLFVDEVHRYRTWAVELKNIFDSYPDFNVVFTGSSLLQMEMGQADLSRRPRMYDMAGLSLREFLKMNGVANLPVLTIKDIVTRHSEIAADIAAQVKVLPQFERNFSTLLLAGEVYWQLGLVNTAQRYAFEAMEAIPDYSKSCRAVKRLVETNLINGQYDVARKYLQMLEKTVSYRKWAQRTKKLLGDEKAINADPVYGHMRQLRLNDDMLFSEQELDKIIGQLLMQNPKNGMAMQYLLLYPLLERDINKFMNYMTYVDGLKSGYRPRICQEAVAFAFAQRNQQPPQGFVNPLVMNSFSDFARIYSAGSNAAALAWIRVVSNKGISVFSDETKSPSSVQPNTIP